MEAPGRVTREAQGALKLIQTSEKIARKIYICTSIKFSAFFKHIFSTIQDDIHIYSFVSVKVSI